MNNQIVNNSTIKFKCTIDSQFEEVVNNCSPEQILALLKKVIYSDVEYDLKDNGDTITDVHNIIFERWKQETNQNIITEKMKNTNNTIQKIVDFYISIHNIDNVKISIKSFDAKKPYLISGYEFWIIIKDFSKEIVNLITKTILDFEDENDVEINYMLWTSKQISENKYDFVLKE